MAAMLVADLGNKCAVTTSFQDQLRHLCDKTTQTEETDSVDASLTHILDLPDEVLALIFSFCDATQLIRDLCTVCIRFRSVILNNVVLWKDTYFTWDVKNPNLSLFCNIVSNAPAIRCIRIRHPGTVSDTQLLRLFKDIITNHSKLRTVELECYEPAHGYSSELFDGLHEGCGETLRHLRLQGPLLTSAIPNLFHFSMMTTLELHDATNVKGKDLRDLCDQCPILNWLSLPRATYVRDVDLEYFFEKKHSMLVGFDLSGYMISDKPMVKLYDAPRLVHVSLRDCRNLNWGTFSMMRSLKEIRFVRLRRLRVTGLALTSWLSGSRNLKQLQLLDLQYGYYLGDCVALMISFFCPNLRYLYLGGVPTITKRICERVKENLPNLLYFCCDLIPTP